MAKQFVNVRDVMEVCGISESKAYSILRELNKDLSARGFITIPGKVSRVFFEEKSMEYTSPSKEGLLASIKPNMRITKSFIKRIYGYGVTDTSFPDRAIAALEAAGCSKARQYYESWVNEYESAHNADLKEAAHWYRLECDKEWARKQKGSEEQRIIQEEAELLKRKKRLLMQKSQILTDS